MPGHCLLDDPRDMLGVFGSTDDSEAHPLGPRPFAWICTPWPESEGGRTSGSSGRRGGCWVFVFVWVPVQRPVPASGQLAAVWKWSMHRPAVTLPRLPGPFPDVVRGRRWAARIPPDLHGALRVHGRACRC